MPSKSKAQQKFMGMVHALQKGDMKPSDASASVKKVAKDMKKSDAKDFASTKHKGLPKKVKQEILNRLKEYANKMGRDHLGGDDYTSKRKGGLRDFDGYDNVDYNKDMPMDEGFKSEYEGNDGIIWKKGKSRGGVTNFTPYYKGHNIDFGGHNFKTEKELKDFIKNYILSIQLYRKYRNEAKRSVVHKAAKKGSFPVTLVVVKNGKVVDQESVKTPEAVPAAFNVIQSKHKGAKIHIEDKTGKRLFSESVNERADYKYLTKVILDAKPKYNVYYNTSHNVVNIGGVGYDKGELVKNFNQKPGSSSNIKANFYHANKDPQKTKREVEKLSNGKIKVTIGKGYGNEPIVYYSLKESVIKEYLSPSDVDSAMKEFGIKKIPISSQGERILKGMQKEGFINKVTNKERLIYFVESLGKEKFGYSTKGKPLSPLVSRYWNDITSEAIFFGGKMAAWSVVSNIKDRLANREEVDSTYYMLKDYFNSFGMDTNRSRVFKSAMFHVDEWLKRNKKIAKQIGESKGVPANYMQGRTSDYHTALRGKKKDYSGGTNFKKTNHGQPDVDEEEDDQTNPLNNKQIALKKEDMSSLSSSEKIELYKLYSKAMKAMPGSPNQKKIKVLINKLRKKADLKPLPEYGQRLDLSYLEDEEARLDGTPEPKDAINRDLDEGTMIRMAGKLAQELLPKDVWYRHASDGNKNREFVKSVVKDLARTLNRFYKSHNINVKVQEELIREIGLWRIDHYTGSKPGTIVPGKMIATVRNEKDREKKRAVEKDLAGTLNNFWKRWNIPFRIDLSKKQT